MPKKRPVATTAKPTKAPRVTQSAKTPKAKNLKLALRFFLGSMKPWRWPIIISCVFAIGATILSIFGPKILGQMTTDAVTSLSSTGEINWEPIKNSAILLIILFSISGVLGYFEDFLIGRVAARYIQKTRSQILKKINRLPVSYFDKHKYGDTLSRMTNDVDIIGQMLQSSLSEIIRNIVMIVGILIMMLTISIPLSLIALIAVPISTVFVAKIAARAQKYFRNQQDILGKLNSTIEEDYPGQPIIKTNNHEAASLAAFEAENNSLCESAWKAQFFSSLAFPITHVFTNLSYVAICIVGGYEAIAGVITIGNVQAFIQYVNQFNRPITSIAQIVSTIQLTLAAAERVATFLAEDEEIEYEKAAGSIDAQKIIAQSTIRTAVPTTYAATNLNLSSAPVTFNHVDFSYADNSKRILTDISFTAKPGQTIALVGPTGAGKTTIVNLLMRFYDPTKGQIKIGNLDTKLMTRDEVRDIFGMVLQDTWLFSGTIEENLRYGNEKATLEDIKKICKDIHIDHFIEALPNGYQTRISEDSDNISAGEKQLLTIARAMIANPPMMILDEATSNVDTRTEQLIQDAYTKLSKNRTSFVIAHRLSTIRNADLILVLKRGRIIEQGTHSELLKKNGFYAELYNSQFKK